MNLKPPITKPLNELAPATAPRDSVTTATPDSEPGSVPRTYTPTEEQVQVRGTPEPEPDEDAELLYVDIAALLAGGLPEPPKPDVLTREDGHALFYRRKINVLYGDPESGKSWVSFAAAVEALKAGSRVLLIDADHNGAASVVHRLLALGAPLEALTDPERFRYAEPEDREHLLAVIADARDWKPDLVVVDSIGEVLPLLGLSSNSPDDYTLANRLVLRPLKLCGACVIAVDHMAKNTASRAFGPTGTAAKRRTFDGASYRVALREPFAPGRGGCCSLTVTKDRHGGVRAHCPVNGKATLPAGLFRLTAVAGGSLSWSVSAPRIEDTEPEPDETPKGATAAADADALGGLEPPPASVRDVKERMGWGTDRSREALAAYRERTGNGRNTPVPRTYTPTQEQVQVQGTLGPCAVCGTETTRYGSDGKPLCSDCERAAA